MIQIQTKYLYIIIVVLIVAIVLGTIYSFNILNIPKNNSINNTTNIVHNNTTLHDTEESVPEKQLEAQSYTCGYCQGVGHYGGIESCYECRGTGNIGNETCYNCQGSGKINSKIIRCDGCGGDGILNPGDPGYGYPI